MSRSGGSIATMDLVGVRALHDRVGARVAGKLLTRCTRDKPTHVAIEDLAKSGVTISVRRSHGSIWTALDSSGRTRISGTRLAMRGTWRKLPDVIETAIEGQPVTRIFDHPCLDETMIITSVHIDGEDAEMTITGNSAPLRHVLDCLREEIRP